MTYKQKPDNDVSNIENTPHFLKYSPVYKLPRQLIESFEYHDDLHIWTESRSLFSVYIFSSSNVYPIL